MGGSRQMKRVTWASDLNLCQVKLFLSEESPLEVGIGTQDHLQAKAAISVPPGCMGSDDNFPPGFELQQANAWKSKISQIPLVKWKFPARFEVNRAWQVIAGEESTEVEAQNQREMRVLEAIYPRPSAIPSNPTALGSMEPSNLNQFTPVVPITPIEEEDASMETAVGFSAAGSSSMTSQTVHLPHGKLSSVHGATTPATVLQPDIVAAAQAALASIMSSSAQGNLIDPELLIKILRDPKMIEQLVANQGATSNAQSFPSSSSQNIPSSTTFHSKPTIGVQGFPSTSKQHMPSPSVQSMSAIGMQNIASSGTPGIPSTSTQYVPSLRPRPMDPLASASGHVTRPEILASASGHVTRPEILAPTTTGTGPFYPQPQVGAITNLRTATPEMVSAASSSMGAPGTKDINYYKSLIQQHGGERRDSTAHFPHQSNQALMTNQEQLNVGKSRDSKQKKPCMFFNSARGCRNGVNCTFQHELSSQIRVGSVPEVQSTKRMKLDREITGS